jgi:phosphotransferase system HPr (HPr) family protein
MPERKITVSNRLGLHARAAARLVQLAGNYRCQVRLRRVDNNQPADGKSILGVLLLAASFGTELVVTTTGEGEEEALEAICQLITEKFGES